jgi:hypothetical protein
MRGTCPLLCRESRKRTGAFRAASCHGVSTFRKKGMFRFGFACVLFLCFYILLKLFFADIII